MRWFRRMFESAPDDRDEAARWNGFLERYGMRHYRAVDRAHKPAYLVYRYFSEVYNGGHVQFFLNCRKLPFEAVSQALRDVAGPNAAENFDRALMLWKDLDPEPPNTSEEYLEIASDDGMEEHDKFMYELDPIIEDRLLKYLIERKLI